MREAVGVMDMSLMSKFLVQGPDAGTVLNRLSVSQVDGDAGRVVYTQWCQDDGGLLADLTVTKLADERFLVVASDVIHRRVETMLRRAPGPGEVAIATDVTPGTTLLSVQGPASRDAPGLAVAGRLVGRGLPLPRRARGRGRRRRGSSRCG